MEFWFDLACPYAYLASTQVRHLAERSDAELLYRPVLLSELTQLSGSREQGACAQKDRILRDDLERWAAWYGVAFGPGRAPEDTSTALRLLLAARESCPVLVDHLFSAVWVEGADPGDPAVLAKALQDAGLEPGLLDVARAPETGDHLRHMGEEAAGKGVFGVPSIVIGDEVFWGQDRLHFVEMTLAGWRTPVEEVAR